jgi:hypothetical protein
MSNFRGNKLYLGFFGKILKGWLEHNGCWGAVFKCQVFCKYLKYTKACLTQVIAEKRFLPFTGMTLQGRDEVDWKFGALFPSEILRCHDTPR